MKTKTRIGGSMRDLGSWILHHNLLGQLLCLLTLLVEVGPEELLRVNTQDVFNLIGGKHMRY